MFSLIKLTMNKLHIRGVSKFKYGIKLILFCCMICLMLTKFTHRNVPLKAAVRKHILGRVFWGVNTSANVFICDLHIFLIKGHFFPYTNNTYVSYAPLSPIQYIQASLKFWMHIQNAFFFSSYVGNKACRSEVSLGYSNIWVLDSCTQDGNQKHVVSNLRELQGDGCLCMDFKRRWSQLVSGHSLSNHCSAVCS